ncbi:MAG TPA: CoA transferase, partial [Sporolactobacillaceae bacterium]|nr:CoA transferase [Sporolactobacillaceae bacterium]
DEQWRALVEEMDKPAWALDACFVTVESRKQNEDDLDAKLTTYTVGCERYELMNRLQARGIPAGVVQKASDRFDRDPQLKARGYYVDLPHSDIGTWPVEGFPARMSRSPADVGGPTGRAAPKLGEDNDFVYGKLVGLSDEEIASLKEEGVI